MSRQHELRERRNPAEPNSGERVEGAEPRQEHIRAVLSRYSPGERHLLFRDLPEGEYDADHLASDLAFLGGEDFYDGEMIQGEAEYFDPPPLPQPPQVEPPKDPDPPEPPTE